LGPEKAEGMELLYPSARGSTPEYALEQTEAVCAPADLTSWLQTLTQRFLAHVLILFHVFFHLIFQQ